MPAMVIFEEGAGVLGWANVRGRKSCIRCRRSQYAVLDRIGPVLCSNLADCLISRRFRAVGRP